ncbi:MAG: M23 family metallopeptidase [Planctomycetes bacterium]|nr:M23 family metallopeptidase [Planctomycetota bacterium]
MTITAIIAALLFCCTPALAEEYRLPWDCDDSHRLIQGNGGRVSHYNERNFHAFDFMMPEGTAVVAAKSGTVVRVKEDESENVVTGGKNNYITIDHGDGTFSHYLHLRHDGAIAQVGDVVARGDHIAYSGNTGNSMMPHLHFHVTGEDFSRTIPSGFEEVGEPGGVPQPLRSYKSANYPESLRAAHDAFRELVSRIERRLRYGLTASAGDLLVELEAVSLAGVLRAERGLVSARESLSSTIRSLESKLRIGAWKYFRDAGIVDLFEDNPPSSRETRLTRFEQRLLGDAPEDARLRYLLYTSPLIGDDGTYALALNSLEESDYAFSRDKLIVLDNAVSAQESADYARALSLYRHYLFLEPESAFKVELQADVARMREIGEGD